MTNPKELNQELVDWGLRHDYPPYLHDADYTRWRKWEKQIDPPRYEDQTVFTNVCETCCKHWLVITINREKKWINKSGGLAKKIYKLRGDGDWYVTTGTLKLELWNNEQGDYKELLLETGSVERGGPGTLQEGQARMIPTGTYKLGGADGSKHSTDSYNPEPGEKRLPGINIRGNGVSSGRGINIHSAGNWAYSTGCVLPVPKKFISRKNVSGTMSNLPPNWQSNIEESHNQVVFMINQLKAANTITKIERRQFNCAKLIVTENSILDNDFITVVNGEKGYYVSDE